MSGTTLDGKHGQIRTGPQTSVRLHRLPVRPEGGHGHTHRRVLAEFKCKDTESAHITHLSSQVVDVPNRAVNTYREASPPRSTPYEADRVALEKQLEGARITRKFDPYPKVAPSQLKIAAPGRKRSSLPAIKHPIMLCKSLKTHQKKVGALS